MLMPSSASLEFLMTDYMHTYITVYIYYTYRIYIPVENLPDPHVVASTVLLQIHSRFDARQASFPGEIQTVLDLLTRRGPMIKCVYAL